MNQFDDETLSPEQLEQCAALAGFNLAVPATAARKKGVARWTEYVTVEEAYRELEVSEKNSATRTVFSLKAKVIPGPGTTNDNVGRPLNDFMRVNFGVLKGNNASAGTNDPKKELTMSAMALSTLKMLAQAAGIDLTGGITKTILEALFPLEGQGQSILVGQHFAFVVTNDENRQTPRGENTQGISAILKAPEGV